MPPKNAACDHFAAFFPSREPAIAHRTADYNHVQCHELAGTLKPARVHGERAEPELTVQNCPTFDRDWNSAVGGAPN